MDSLSAVPKNDGTPGSGNCTGAAFDTDSKQREVSYPEINTVKAAVLADLLDGREITHKDTWREHGSSRLAHHVFMLRKLGWPIICKKRYVQTADGRCARIGFYSLAKAREAG